MRASPSFADVNAAALAQYPDLLESWLPGGKVEGDEYVCGSISGGPGRSFKVNWTTGLWSEFNGGSASGNDPVSLYAAIHGMKQGEARHELVEALKVPANGNSAASRPKRQEWAAILPIPAEAPTPTFEHFRNGTPSAAWAYRDSYGNTLGHACRFDSQEGRKDILPLTFCREPGGRKEWRWQAFPEPRPLYGLDRLAQVKADAGILLVEGEKTADAAARLRGPGKVCMTWPNGSKAVGKVDLSPLAGRPVCIWPDADKPGFDAALALAGRLKEVGAASVSIIVPPAVVAQGWDLADAEAEGWTPDKVTAWIKEHTVTPEEFQAVAHERYGIEAKPEAAPAKSKKNAGSGLGNSFSLRDSGVFFMVDNDGSPEWEWVCSPLHILARTRNVDGQEWGCLLEVLDSEGRAHRWAMPSRLMAGNGDGYRSELLALGLRIAPGLKGKQRLDLYLSTAKVEGFARCVERIGWQGNAFVLPDAVYGEQAGELIVPQGIPSENPFRQKGSLEEWREHVGRVCAGNSRLVLAVSTALAASLLEPLGQESGGLHLVGGSSLGKTTALRVAGSVCGGGPGGFIKQWRATDNGLESIAAAHCDALLCLDEMGQAGAKVVSEVAYMLANGQGKGRASRDGQARKVHTWRLLFLSTGEVTLADKVAEDGRGRAKAGQAVRVVDIPANAGAGLGLFEALHGCGNADLFARQLKEVSTNYYGTPLRAFLQALAADRDTLTRQAQESMRTFEAAHCPEGADGQVRRVCGRFALVAAAGELGVSLGVLPWPIGEASKATATCFRAWIEQRGGTGAAEVTAGLEQVRRFFQAHGASRFEDLDSEEHRTVINRVGYRRRENGEAVFLVFPEEFRQVVCAGCNYKMLAGELIRRGLIEAQPPHQTRKLRNPEGRFYVVRASILSGDTGDSGDTLEPQRFEPSPVAGTPSGDSGDTWPPGAPSLASVPSVPSTDFAEWGRAEASNTNDVPSVPSVPSENCRGTKNPPCPDKVTI